MNRQCYIYLIIDARVLSPVEDSFVQPKFDIESEDVLDVRQRTVRGRPAELGVINESFGVSPLRRNPTSRLRCLGK
jgi:hypothetical protein